MRLDSEREVAQDLGTEPITQPYILETNQASLRMGLWALLPLRPKWEVAAVP
jgi:hypothetical protein